MRGPSIEWGFSPEGTADALDARFIAAARHELRVMAYVMTSVPMAARLIAAAARGVDVAVVCDYRENIIATGYNGKPGMGIPDLTRLVQGGVRVRTNAMYPVHHDKLLISDQEHLRTGSCNFSLSAERANSENVLVLWRRRALAAAFLAHWTSRWAQGEDFVPA